MWNSRRIIGAVGAMFLCAGLAGAEEGAFVPSPRDLMNFVETPSRIVFTQREVSLLELEVAAMKVINLHKLYGAPEHTLAGAIAGALEDEDFDHFDYFGYLEFIKANFLHGPDLVVVVGFGKDNVMLKFRLMQDSDSWQLLHHQRLGVTSVDLLDREEMLSNTLQHKQVHSVRLVGEDIYYGCYSFVDTSFRRKNHICRMSSDSDVLVFETLSPVHWDKEGIVYFDNGVPYRLELTENSKTALDGGCFAERGEQVVLDVRNFLLFFEGSPYFFRVGEPGGGDFDVAVVSCRLPKDASVSIHHDDLRFPMNIFRDGEHLALRTKTRTLHLPEVRDGQ